MHQQIKEDWIINNSNIFGLPKDIKFSIFIIQVEILDQLEGANINSISEYLKADISIADKEINLANFKFFKQTLKDNFSHILRSDKISCSMLLQNIQDFLLDGYYTNNHKNILRFSEYKSQYSEFLKDYLHTTIDTDENDFIKAEIMLCDSLLLELEKPIYNEITAFNEVLNEPCLFKSSLSNSIDKRKKFLVQKQLKPQQTEKPKPELKLNEFFIKEVSSDTIEAIQTEYRELEGKSLAILIYLLHKEHKIIEILTNSRTKGRKGFVKCLKETDNPTMQKVNKCFTPNTDDLIYSKDDLVFQSLNKRLTETIKI